MKRLFLLLLGFLFFSGVFALERKSAVCTSVDNGRYEIIQSEIMRSLIFLLDKYTGDVYQNVITSGEERCWEKRSVVGDSEDKTPKNKINYQLFMGGLSVQDIMLLNINTGETWYLLEDPIYNEIYFSKSKKQSDL